MEKIMPRDGRSVEGDDEEKTDARARGAESCGAIRGGGSWKIFETSEGHCLVVAAAPGVRAKRRLPRRLETPEQRRLFASSVAPDVKAKALQDAIVRDRGAPPTKTNPTKITFAELGRLWTSGELTKRFPDHIPAKSSAAADQSRLDHLNKTIGHVAIEDFSLDDAERAMTNLPKTCKAPGTRRQYGQVVRRVIAMSVYPLRLRADNPIPKNFMPKIGKSSAVQWVYPSEESQVASCTAIPLARRLLWGVLAREGMRDGSEAIALTWGSLDLERGTLRLDRNKSRVPRTWKLDPSVKRALLKWRKIRFPDPDEPAPANGFVLVDEHGFPWGEARLAELFRADLKIAGVKRPELFEKVPGVRNPVRAHDLRSSFVTVKLSLGWTEAQISAKTGHQSSQMIARYRRVAKLAEEIDVGDFLPLDVLLFGDDDGSPERNGPNEGDRSGPIPPPDATSGKGREGSSGSVPSSPPRDDAEDCTPSHALASTLNPLVSGSSPGWPTFSNDDELLRTVDAGFPRPASPWKADVSEQRDTALAGTRDAGTGSGTPIRSAVDSEHERELRRVALIVLAMLDPEVMDIDGARAELRAFLRNR